MPEVQHTTEVAATLPQIWSFVKDMDNWAPLLMGYEKHEKLNEDESIWCVRGELSGMTREAEFRVHVTEWAGPERVTFVMEGLQEPVKGSGHFLATEIGGAGSDAGAVSAAAMQAQKTVGWFQRLRDNIARRLLSLVFKPPAPVVGAVPASNAVPVGDRAKLSRITFKLALNAGGATGPVLNLLLAPMLKPVAEEFAIKIANEIEARVV